jgi:gas vesicle protein
LGTVTNSLKIVESVGTLAVVVFAEKGSPLGMAITGVAGIVSGSIGLSGALKSADEVTRDLIKTSFTMLNQRLNDLEGFIRKGFNEIKQLISDVALDELASLLDSTGRALNDVVNDVVNSTSYEARF